MKSLRADGAQKAGFALDDWAMSDQIPGLNQAFLHSDSTVVAELVLLALVDRHL